MKNKIMLSFMMIDSACKMLLPNLKNIFIPRDLYLFGTYTTWLLVNLVFY